MKELIRRRFIQSDWPDKLGKLVNGITLEELRVWVDMEDDEGSIFLESLLNKKSSGSPNQFEPGFLMEDFYLFKNGGDLGKALIPDDRKNFYSTLIEKKKGWNPNDKSLQGQMNQFSYILSRLMGGLPSDDFIINFENQEITKF